MTQVIAPTREHCEEAVRRLPRLRRRKAGVAHGGQRQDVQFGNVWWFDVAPGALRLGEYQASKWENAQLADIDARDNGVMTDDQAGGPPKRGKVQLLSRWSMNRMIYRLASLDYTPLFEGGGRPIMLTLSLPDKWETIAPTPTEFQKVVKRFLARYQRAWGGRIIGVWKREFQRRGAPHLHVLMTIPEGRTRGDGLLFRDWVGPTWAQVCLPAGYDARDDRQRHAYRDHAMRGTTIEDADLEHVDLDDFIEQYELHAARGAHVSEQNLIDPRRITAYFTKHGAFASKGYQNEVPELWEEAGEGAGRYWGYWGLEDATVRTEIGADDEPDDDGPDDDGSGGSRPAPRAPRGGGGAGAGAEGHNASIIGVPETRVLIGRAMRRLSRARSYTRPEKVWRQSIDYDTGEVRGRFRKVTRRVDPLAGRSKGFLIVNDGPTLAAAITEHVLQRQTGPAVAYGPLTRRQARIQELRERASVR